jgi:hypothetical protein
MSYQFNRIIFGSIELQLQTSRQLLSISGTELDIELIGNPGPAEKFPGKVG